MLFFVLADGVTEVLGEGLDLSQDQVTLSGQWRVGPQWWRSATRGGFSPSIPQGSNSESQGDQEFVVQKMESGRGGQTRRPSAPGCFVSFGVVEKASRRRRWGSEVVPSFVWGSLHPSVEGPSGPCVPPAEVRFAAPGTYRRRSLGPLDRAC